MVWYQTNDQQVWAFVKTLTQIRHLRLIGLGRRRTPEPLAEGAWPGRR